jgi:hypothetical protein
MYDDPSGGAGGSVGSSGTTTPLVAPDSDGGAGLLGTGFGLDTMQMCEQWGFQGSVYLATGMLSVLVPMPDNANGGRDIATADSADTRPVVECDYSCSSTRIPGGCGFRRGRVYTGSDDGYGDMPVPELWVDELPAAFGIACVLEKRSGVCSS